MIAQLVGCVVQQRRKLIETIVAEISFIIDATPLDSLNGIVRDLASPRSIKTDYIFSSSGFARGDKNLFKS